MKTPTNMTVEKARATAAQVAAARTKWGKHATDFVSQHELLDAITILHENGEFDAAGVKDQLTLSNRRYAALNAQHEKLKKAYAELKYRLEGLEK